MKKGQVKISTYIIALVLVSLVFVFFSLFMSAIADAYNFSYDNSTFEVYNQLDYLSNVTEDIQDESAIEQPENVLDVIGGFFNDAYQALQVTKQSFTAFEKMNNAAIDHLKIGVSGRYLKQAITLIVLILIFVGVLLSAIVKRDL